MAVDKEKGVISLMWHRRAVLLTIILIFCMLVLFYTREKLPNGPSFCFNERKYLMTYELVDYVNIEDEIGIIETQVKTWPTKDGEGFRLTKGTRLYKVKNISIDAEGFEGQIAVMHEGNFYIARKIVRFK